MKREEAEAMRVVAEEKRATTREQYAQLMSDVTWARRVLTELLMHRVGRREWCRAQEILALRDSIEALSSLAEEQIAEMDRIDAQMHYHAQRAGLLDGQEG